MWFLSLAGCPLVCIGWSPSGVTVAWAGGTSPVPVQVAVAAGRGVPRDGRAGHVGAVCVALRCGRGGDALWAFLHLPYRGRRSLQVCAALLL
jgi:hypothetical protein